MGLWLQEQLVSWAWEVQLTVVDAMVCKVEELLLVLQQRWVSFLRHILPSRFNSAL